MTLIIFKFLFNSYFKFLFEICCSLEVSGGTGIDVGFGRLDTGLNQTWPCISYMTVESSSSSLSPGKTIHKAVNTSAVRKKAGLGDQ